jgi:hypothetical protein
VGMLAGPSGASVFDVLCCHINSSRTNWHSPGPRITCKGSCAYTAAIHAASARRSSPSWMVTNGGIAGVFPTLEQSQPILKATAFISRFANGNCDTRC